MNSSKLVQLSESILKSILKIIVKIKVQCIGKSSIRLTISLIGVCVSLYNFVDLN